VFYIVSRAIALSHKVCDAKATYYLVKYDRSLRREKTLGNASHILVRPELSMKSINVLPTAFPVSVSVPELTFNQCSAEYM